MLLNRTINKKILEKLVHETFSQFGSVCSSSLLDSLKLLGFYYATNAGISISLEDLKTPNIKKDFIKKANNEITEISKQWEQGFVSDNERFQSIIDSWNVATESLKNRIVDYYQTFDPANNLYIMAFSGARGNMSQVRQLVGMRGLMSDQEGKIIDLPIQANFREGLSSIDYIISSYGARKGIVDTALKTADSGYLTRRLIYVAQDLIIREIDCKANSGLLVLLNKSTNITNLIGCTLLEYSRKKNNYKKNYENNLTLTANNLKELKAISPLVLKIRSSLTCKSNGSVCQKCYGWDLATEKLISLGEAVGIIAAQSIGEPGTQLTMRTFHTGGIFTSESLKQILAPFSGKLIIPKNLKTLSYRTNHGAMVLKLQQEAKLFLVDWKGFTKDIFLDIDSYLYISKTGFIKKGDLISEYSTLALLPGPRRLKPIYTYSSGEIKFNNLVISHKTLKDGKNIKINKDDSVLWIASGKYFNLPKEFKYIKRESLNLKKPFSFLKIVTPVEGIVTYNENNLSILAYDKRINLELLSIIRKLTNCTVKISTLVKNYQFVDAHTILGFVEIYPNFDGLIYAIRIKENKDFQQLFFISERDVWKINSDQINNLPSFSQQKIPVRTGTFINATSTFSRSGYFLRKDGFKMIFQNAQAIFLSGGTILNYSKGDFILEKEILAKLVNYTQQTEDIVQGLPKIDELIEARHPNIKKKAQLCKNPGIYVVPFVSADNKEQHFLTTLNNKIISCSDIKITSKTIATPTKKIKKKYAYIANKIDNNFVFFNSELFKLVNIPPIFSTTTFRDKNGLALLLDGKGLSPKWTIAKNLNEKNKKLFKFKNNELIEYQTNFKTVLKNKKGEYILVTDSDKAFYLEIIKPFYEYELEINAKITVDPGSFVDIGEPITEGILDIHDLLDIIFKYHLKLDGIYEGTLKSVNKFQLLLVNSIQAIYQSQGVNISSKHIEIIVCKMTSNIVIDSGGDSPLLPGEIIRFSLMSIIDKTLKNSRFKTPYYHPVLMSSTLISLRNDGFLSAAGFQETKKVLTKAAIEGSCDWLRNLKECVIIGRLIPAGSAFLNYKNYLDNVYFFKNDNIKKK